MVMGDTATTLCGCSGATRYLGVGAREGDADLGAGVGLGMTVVFLFSPLPEKLFWWGHARSISAGTGARG